MKSKTTKKIIDFLTKKRVTDIENSAEKNGRKFYNEVPFLVDLGLQKQKEDKLNNN
jgi:hypothetical protein